MASLFVVGFGFSYGNVIWGTLLQRRVPRHMLGRSRAWTSSSRSP